MPPVWKGEDVMSKRIRLAFTALVVTATVAVGSSTNATSVLHGDYITFSAPFALPGVSLPAGTYLFETPLPPSSLDVVRVWSREGRHLYFGAFTKTVARPAGRTSTPPVVFSEAVGTTPPQVAVWYPVGERIGHEFVY
jgi:hypothetical protein